ncbi:DUF3883 domain-containing protein [Arthrobacter sp. SLBN-112]|uniref:DUF3883 domain-containing protein n=1 Tax=Arthrobacter sp. SLBN-112 TaxID=2768452 RepID=UPI0027B5ABAD|nr:DUF3883 domain-containing protein [Arthrobacter sp. SLBN-112]MDQ0802163.1 hypothetical protein [Arthrobacter sp. SLBN-112]
MSNWELGELQHLSRSADHLGSLANVLKDLGGDETILHELTQNADDAEDATRIRFSVDADALTVWNDGQFSNCGHQERKQCPWRSERARSCDLHSFRLFSGRHKSGDSSTTGAFGVGFTCVYHLTDHPELVTAGTHLLLDEGASEDQRIRVCKLETCPRDHMAAGTTFVLPWARGESVLRQQLEVETVSNERIERLGASFRREASATLIFLKRVSTIELVLGAEVLTVEREVDDDVVRVIADGRTEEWLLLQNQYETSDVLKRRHRDIDPNRNALVQVALCVGGSVSGRFYAGLPSQMPTGWGGHINGSFYPRTDRKSFEFADGTYRSEWNLDLLDSAAHLVAENLERIAEVTGVTSTWGILRDLQRVARDVGEGKLPLGFDQFFNKVAEAAAGAAILRVVDGSVTVPAGALLPMEVAHYAGARVVHDLGLPIVNGDLRSIVFETEYSKYGINQLTAARLVEHMVNDGQLARAWEAEDAILELKDVDLLLELLESLLDRSKSWIEEPETSQLALIPCKGARYAPARDVVRIDDDALREFFTHIDPDLLVVDGDRLATKSPTMLGLVRGLTLETGLESLCNSANPSLLTENAELLIAWFEDQSSALEVNETAQADVRSMAIFPRSSTGRDSLEHLSVPSDFDDLFGVADLIDADFARDHRSLLTAVGAEELSSVEYLSKHLIPRLGELDSDPQYLEFALDLVQNSRRDLDHAPLVIEALWSAPLVPCVDGIARRGCDVHMPNTLVSLIDPEAPIVDLQAIGNYLHDTVVWLGASTIPSHSLVNEAARRLAEEAANPSPAVYAAILEAIADAPAKFASVPVSLANLRDLPWLPVEGGGKGKPSDLYPIFQSYLFESQGPKLGLSRANQFEYSELLSWLGMPKEPTLTMVTAHLRHCAAAGAIMNNEVYVWLGRQPEGAALKALADQPVIQTSPGTFIHPRQAFWQLTRLGRWASQLPREMRRYQEFLDAMGITEEPTANDLDFILKLISNEVGTSPLDPEDELVVHECWSLLGSLLTEDPDTTRTLQLIGRRPSFPDQRGVLARPERLIFRDPRKMADQIALLVNDVIDRERGTQRALEYAGVTKAEDVIEVEPVEVVSAADDGLMALIEERENALMRAIDGVTAPRPDLRVKPGIIRDLDIRRATTLNVVYRASIGSQQFATPPQSIDAMFFPDEFRVVHTSTTNKIPVAREISRAIAPDLDPSELAPLIVTVLDAISAEDAMHRLDDYGIASVIDVDRETIASTVAVDVIKEHKDDQLSDENVRDIAEPHQVDAGHGVHSQSAALGDNDVEDAEAHQEVTNAGARDSARTSPDSSNRGGGASFGTEGTRFRRDANSGTTGVGQKDRGRAGSATRMRSYVLFGDDSAHGTNGDESPDALEIDRAGVDRVLAYERSRGREPEEQDHTNPGFDVLSRGNDSQIARRIEIKSIRGEWTIRGVMLSARQFREAKEYADQFWLYIVENAEDDDLYRIHRIKDPVNQIDFFGFDSGWEALREPDVDLDARGMPAVRSTRGLLGLSPGGRRTISDDD